MSYGVDKLKSQIAKSNGIAVGNQWVLVLPRVPGTLLESRELNILAKELLFPGRAHVSQPRIIGVKGIDAVNGFTEQEIIVRFHVLNDWGIVDYFYKWQDLVLEFMHYRKIKVMILLRLEKRKQLMLYLTY